MPPVKGVAPQPMVGWAYNQPVADFGQPQAAPEGLGRSHSIGKTILRVSLFFLSAGISEIIRGIIRAVESAKAPALPHLPQNGANDILMANNAPVFPLLPQNGANNILMANNAPVLPLLPQNGANDIPMANNAPVLPLLPQNDAKNIRANARMAKQLDGGNAALREIVDRGKARATSALGMNTELNRRIFSVSLKRAIEKCNTALDGEGLEALAEKVARDDMAKAIATTLVKKAPGYAGQTAEQKTLLVEVLLNTPQMKEVHDAASPEAMEPLLAKVKDMVQEQSASQKVQNACMRELFNTGMEAFCKKTELDPASCIMNTWSLENEFNMMVSDLDKKFATEARPYAKADKKAIMEAWKPRAELFFNERAEAYMSIAKLDDVPEALKKDWQQRCMTSEMPIEHDTFTKSANIAGMVMSTASLHGLLNTGMSVEEKIKILEDYAVTVSNAIVKSFGEERLAAMGQDEQAVVSDLAYEVIFSKSTWTLENLRDQPELLTKLGDAIAARQEEAKGAKVQDHDNLEKVAGGNKLFQQIMGKNREAADLVITNRGLAKATSVLGQATELNEYTFKTALKKAVNAANNLDLNGDKLEALAEKVARDVLTASIAKDLVNKAPNNTDLTNKERDLKARLLEESPEMKAVHDAASPEAMEPLLAKAKDMVQEMSTSRVTKNACLQELLADGMQTFCNMTGLALGSFTMETSSLEGKLSKMVDDLDRKVATEAHPYAKAGKVAIMVACRPTAELFFTERAQAYMSIAKLKVPEALKKVWQQRCLTDNKHIKHDTFTKSAVMAARIMKTATASLKGLLKTKMSLADKVKIFEDIAVSLNKVMLKILGKERKTMDSDDLIVFNGLAYEIVFANNTVVLDALRGQPELIKEVEVLDEVIDDKVEEVMDRVGEETSEYRRITGGGELFRLLRTEVKPRKEYALVMESAL